MPLSEPFVHSGAFLSLCKQPPHSGFVSTWSQKCPFCLQSRRSACIPLTLTLTFLFCILPEQAVLMTTALKAFCWGTHVAISSALQGGHVAPVLFFCCLFFCGWCVPSPTASSSSLFLKSLWLNSPHRVFSLIKPFCWISLFFSSLVPVGRLKWWYNRYQSFSLHILWMSISKWKLTLSIILQSCK